MSNNREYCYQKYGSLSIPKMLEMIQARDEQLKGLVDAAWRFRNCAIVDDDFPMLRDEFDRLLMIAKDEILE